MGILKSYFKRVFTKKHRYVNHRFADSFVSQVPVNENYDFFSNLPRRIFCFWTGSNEMSNQRKNAYDLLVKNAGVEVVLITPENLKDYILPGKPLHPCYNYLSLVHKADYLRCYFMHHYGGGYSDIKSAHSSWQSAFEKLEKRKSKWILGYREIGKRGVAPVGGTTGFEIKKNWHILLGNGSYICKPYSPFTSEWHEELNRRMDRYHEDLKANPGNVMGDNSGYPISWTNILGDIFHPLCLKYSNRLMYSNKIKPIFKNFR